STTAIDRIVGDTARDSAVTHTHHGGGGGALERDRVCEGQKTWDVAGLEAAADGFVFSCCYIKFSIGFFCFLLLCFYI
ncbi:MAG: hypothetical protein ACK49J_07295, partial [Verrucomicrobiota bacterium]